uniref:Uncharacterized protein n=1 Tax=Rhizophora mucronata TaxID=61149 RepID=A0A2P2N789_RHIMU
MKTKPLSSKNEMN